jgi:chromosome partitioning protein
LRTIAVLNQKGGVGKTTSAVNTAAALAAAGRRVVVIDFDPQAHMTIHLGVEPTAVQKGAYEVLTESAGFEESLMLVRPNLWLLGANINLVGAETELVNVVGREIILRDAMRSCQDKFDFCLIDCAPSLGLLSLNALAAAGEVLIPLQPHFLALQGVGKLLQTVDLVNKRINPQLKVTGVLLCMHDTRASLSNEVRADIEGFLDSARGTNSAWDGAVILPAFIRRNIKLAEAPSYGQTIFEYDPACNGAEDYRKVGNFFLGISEDSEEEVEPVESQPASEPQAEAEIQVEEAVPAPAPIEACEVEPTAEAVPLQPEPQVQTPPQAETASAPVPIEIREVSLPARQEETPAVIEAAESVEPQPEPQPQTPAEIPPAVGQIEIREVRLPAPVYTEPTPAAPEPSSPPLELPPDCCGV